MTKKKQTPFRFWLNSMGWSANRFVREAGAVGYTWVSYPNVAKWARGAHPREPAFSLLREKFPSIEF